jgi:CheY-like chemotaxis protein/phosphoribosyl 1,2-cyclic phosphodiesterase
MHQRPSPAPRVLVADDDKSVALVMSAFLTEAGCEVQLAQDGQECLAKVGSFKPALIFLDLMMPKVHGIDVLRRLKADPATSEIGIVMCTAKRYKSDHDQALELGAFEVLLKPFQKEDLLAVLDRFFMGAGAAPAVEPAHPSGQTYLPKIPANRQYCRLWGTRGSIPVAGQRYIRHGGNTSCLEVGNGPETIIADAGTGIRDLGVNLLKQGPRRVHILITHTHWDHIQGFPFFAPAYVPGFELVIYGATTFKKDIRSVFSGLLDRDYFPVQFEDMRANFEFRSLEAPLEIGGFRISWEYTQHPSATVAYKFERDGKALTYVSDNEFLYGYTGPPQAIRRQCQELQFHEKLVDFVAGTELLLGEAQYFNEDYPGKIGWGHSSVTNACVLASLAKVKRWLVTHHDPAHDDETLDHKLNLTREVLRELNQPIEVGHAYDGLIQYW